MAGRSHIWLPQDSAARGLPQYRFAYHDKEELGPVILAEIAKHTGLRPEDL